jgi:hypothetical protein
MYFWYMILIMSILSSFTHETIMTVFDQRKQKVGTQFNVSGNINFNSVQGSVELINQIERIKSEVTLAGESKSIDADLVTETNYHLQKAVNQALKAEPNKPALLENLKKAEGGLKDIVAVGGIATAIMKLTDLVQNFF